VFDRRVAGETLTFGVSGPPLSIEPPDVRPFRDALETEPLEPASGAGGCWAGGRRGPHDRPRPFALARWDDWKRAIRKHGLGTGRRRRKEIRPGRLRVVLQLRRAPLSCRPLPPQGPLGWKTRVFVAGPPGARTVTPIEVQRDESRLESSAPRVRTAAASTRSGSPGMRPTPDDPADSWTRAVAALSAFEKRGGALGGLFSRADAVGIPNAPRMLPARNRPACAGGRARSHSKSALPPTSNWGIACGSGRPSRGSARGGSRGCAAACRASVLRGWGRRLRGVGARRAAQERAEDGRPSAPAFELLADVAAREDRRPSVRGTKKPKPSRGPRRRHAHTRC
jgi:hypothetical protein